MHRLETRAENEISGNTLIGYASVFGTYANLGSHLEAINERAFNEVLAAPNLDTVALWNHDMNYPLGRITSGTLKLSTDSRGLHYEVELPSTSYANDLRELVDRGDVVGSSFGFVPGDDEWSVRARHRIRTHTRVARLVDVSPVTLPAYPNTSVSVRNDRARLIRVRNNTRKAINV